MGACTLADGLDGSFASGTFSGSLVDSDAGSLAGFEAESGSCSDSTSG